MNRRRLLVALAVGMALGGPAPAREVDYAAIDAQGFAATAARLKIAPVMPLPPGAAGVALAAQPAADHDVMALGQYCVFRITNPVTRLVAQLAAAPPPAPAVSISITRARSFRRCVEVGELNVRCITRVTLDADVARSGQPARPLTVIVERDASIGGFCEDVARGVGVITRQAMHELLDRATAGA
jgi:hypothetical protein